MYNKNEGNYVINKEKILKEFDEKFSALLIIKDGSCKGKIETVKLIKQFLLSKLEEVERKGDGETSDGYHTFNELYEHRVLLWINLCLITPSDCYVAEDHYEGWFLLGAETSIGQVSYHCPNKYIDFVQNIKRKSVKFDGHTPSDVIERLKERIKELKGGKDNGA